MIEWFAQKILFMPGLASSNGASVDALMVYIHWLMIALFVGWSAYFVFVLWKFNAKRSAKADYEGSKSHLPKGIEISVVLAEAFLLVVVAVPIWAKNVQDFPKPENSTIVQIMAQQFAWNARYPGADGKFGRQDMKLISNDNVFGMDTNDVAGKDDIQVFNEIHVPVDKPVIFYMSSKDVIHSLKLVAMRLTQDAIPGLRIPCTFTPTKIGRYQIECAQLCGNGHAAMAGGFVVVQSKEDYENWLKSKAPASGPPASFE
jgi:cytochrome c oxidase subunit II